MFEELYSDIVRVREINCRGTRGSQFIKLAESEFRLTRQSSPAFPTAQKPRGGHTRSSTSGLSHAMARRICPRDSPPSCVNRPICHYVDHKLWQPVHSSDTPGNSETNAHGQDILPGVCHIRNPGTLQRRYTSGLTGGNPHVESAINAIRRACFCCVSVASRTLVGRAAISLAHVPCEDIARCCQNHSDRGYHSEVQACDFNA